MGRDLPRPGQPVFSNDGTHLGSIGSVDEGAGQVRLDGAGQASWLPFDVIEEVTQRYVLLRIRRYEVDARRWARLGARIRTRDTHTTNR